MSSRHARSRTAAARADAETKAAGDVVPTSDTRTTRNMASKPSVEPGRRRRCEHTVAPCEVLGEGWRREEVTGGVRPYVYYLPPQVPAPAHAHAPAPAPRGRR